MKTAMQELMQWMEETEFMVNREFIDKVNECLEKEKEQIEHAHAHHRCIHDKTMECTIEAYKSAEKYYNQTYNK